MSYRTKWQNYNLGFFQIKDNVSLYEITFSLYEIAFSVILIFVLIFLMTTVTLLHQIIKT